VLKGVKAKQSLPLQLDSNPFSTFATKFSLLRSKLVIQCADLSNMSFRAAQ